MRPGDVSSLSIRVTSPSVNERRHYYGPPRRAKSLSPLAREQEISSLSHVIYARERDEKMIWIIKRAKEKKLFGKVEKR